MTHMLIIGGSDAGISAALRIRELDAKVRVTVAAADAYPNFSICGLPFYLSGEVADWRTLAHRTSAEIESHGIDLLLDHRAERIDAGNKSVHFVSSTGQSATVRYDQLLIGTGAESVRPSIPGMDLPGVFCLRWMADSFAVKDFLDRGAPRRAVIIGGGYIGLEMADALTVRGMAVTLVEFAPEVLTTLDPELGRLIRAELAGKGVTVHVGTAVQGIEQQDGALVVATAAGASIAADMVLVAVGARPATDLARTAGVGLGEGGAIAVDRTMATGVPAIWAAGDCVHTWHRLLQRHVYMPLGTTAHKQGRVAGENMLGGQREFAGSLGTQVVKVCDQVAARTGLRDTGAAAAGFEPLTVALTTWDHKVYYPGATQMHLRVTGCRQTGRLLGAQIVGHRSAEVSKRIDIFAAALYHGMQVADMSHLDLSYTPPLSSPFDPVQMAAMQWCARPPSYA
ncbi:MAG: FAD-dependent oxidoreductase [Desulfatitalea sp.]|nr:FAD-dependent oxidoreductase [Desulfatitalea sp.]